jgi:hypothetical protein
VNAQPGFDSGRRILRLRKRKLQLLPLHFAFSSRQEAKAGAFAYVARREISPLQF